MGPGKLGVYLDFADAIKRLGKQTIAEFVETQAAADILIEAGIDYGQGWLFGKAEAEPRTVSAVTSRARRRGAVEAWG